MNEKNKKTKIIISGKPSSGKSTLAEVIALQLSSMGIEVEVRDEVFPGVPDHEPGVVLENFGLRMCALRAFGKVEIETQQISR